MKKHEIKTKPKAAPRPAVPCPKMDFVAWLEADLARLERKYAGFVTDVSTRASLKGDRRRSKKS